MARTTVNLDGEVTLVYTVQITQVVKTPSDEKAAEKFVVAAKQRLEKNISKLGVDDVKVLKEKKFENLG